MQIGIGGMIVAIACLYEGAVMLGYSKLNTTYALKFIIIFLTDENFGNKKFILNKVCFWSFIVIICMYNFHQLVIDINQTLMKTPLAPFTNMD